MRTPTEVRLGDVLVKEGLITARQLDAALKEQAQRESYVPLGKILVERGLITQKQLNLVLNQSDKRPRLGEVLLRSGSITQERLDQALAEQRHRHRPLGQVLVQMGLVSDETMRQALGMQLNIAFLDLDRMDLDRSLARVINRNYARRHLLVPVSCSRRRAASTRPSSSEVLPTASSRGMPVSWIQAALTSTMVPSGRRVQTLASGDHRNIAAYRCSLSRRAFTCSTLATTASLSCRYRSTTRSTPGARTK
jgi:hypothetical protein